MTAAGLDYVSGGRFTLGNRRLWPAGHRGVPRREVRRSARPHPGDHRDLPAGLAARQGGAQREALRRFRCPPDQGTGLGKPLKLINHPVRAHIPIQVAALGPKNVALAAELAEVWEPIFFHVGKAHDVWGASLDEGAALRSPDLPPLGIAVPISVAIGAGAESFRDQTRNELALYIGGMGAKDQNFYAQLATRYGYGEAASEIQDLYLAGSKAEAAARVPDDLVEGVSLIGTEAEVSAKLLQLKQFGVTKLEVKFLEPGQDKQLETLTRLKELLP